jgi:hypothetical protein
VSVIKHQSRGELAKYLTEVLGLSYNAPEDNLFEFFRAAGTTGALGDMEFEWLGDQGRTELSTVDRWGVYLTEKGYYGSLPDMFYQSILAGDLLTVIDAFIEVTFQGIDVVLDGVFVVWQGADKVTDAYLQGDYLTFQGDDVAVWNIAI